MHSMTSFTTAFAKSNLSYRPPKHSFTVPAGLRGVPKQQVSPAEWRVINVSSHVSHTLPVP